MSYPIIRNIDLEKSVIASSISNGKALHELSTKLDEDDFSDGYLKKIFTELKKCSAKGYEPDLAIMIPKLGDNFPMSIFSELLGGYNHGGVSTSDNIANQCKKLREISTARNLVSKAYKILCEAGNISDHAEFVSKNVSELADIALDYKGGRLNHVSTYFGEAIEEFRAVQAKEELGVRTGIADIDNTTAGFRKGEFIVIAGKPAQGKTSLAMSIIKNMVLANKKIAVFSLEMRSSELILKLSSMMSTFFGEIPNAVFRGVQDVSKEHIESFPKTINLMSESHLYINESPYTTMTDIEIELRRFMKKVHLDAVVVDYMSIIADDETNKGKRHEMIQDYSMRFKRLAKSEKVPIIVLSQIKNDAYNKKPTMADLSESSQLSRDADMVYLLWKPLENDPTRKVIVADKGRGVAGGNFCVHFSTSTTEFTSMTIEDAKKFKKEFMPDETDEQSNNKDKSKKGF